MELSVKRKKRIAEAALDRFVRKNIIDSEEIQNPELNKRFLNQLAKDAGCNVHALTITIEKSIGRIGGFQINRDLPQKEEEKVMIAIAKYHIRGIKVPLKDFKRQFGNVTAELNSKNPNLKLKVKELQEFVYPIYLLALEEVFEN